jgi:hypothetical protein
MNSLFFVIAACLPAGRSAILIEERFPTSGNDIKRRLLMKSLVNVNNMKVQLSSLFGKGGIKGMLWKI